MSIVIHDYPKNCYIVNMDKGALANWLERKYLEWQLENGRGSVEEFSKHLGLSQPYLSLLMLGKRKIIGMNKATQIAKKTNDYSILDILGYARPETVSVPLSSLPPELLKRLESIDAEIKATLKARNITESSPEAKELIRSIIARYGVTFTEN